MLDPRVNGQLDYRTKELRKVLIRVSGRYYHALIEADYERTKALFLINQRQLTLLQQAAFRRPEQRSDLGED